MLPGGCREWNWTKPTPCPLPSQVPLALAMNPDKHPAHDTAIGERRAHERKDVSQDLSLTIETDALTGITENVSGIGVLFFTEGDLRVSVEMDENGERKTRTGRLVRVQRMSLDNTGFAVEFDPE